MVILIEYFIKGRRSHPREWIGIVMAVFGVLWIMLEGDISRLAALAFNPGDLLFLAAALAGPFTPYFFVRNQSLICRHRACCLWWP